VVFSIWASYIVIVSRQRDCACPVVRPSGEVFGEMVDSLQPSHKYNMHCAEFMTQVTTIASLNLVRIAPSGILNKIEKFFAFSNPFSFPCIAVLNRIIV